MKGALIALFIGIVLLVAVYFKLSIYRSKSSFDIHLHDAFYVLDYTSAIILGFMMLGTFFSVGGIIGTHFKSKLFVVLVMLFLSIDTFYVVSFYKAFKNNKDTPFPKE